jgi:hypothetical protein
MSTYLMDQEGVCLPTAHTVMSLISSCKYTRLHGGHEDVSTEDCVIVEMYLIPAVGRSDICHPANP